MFPLLATVVALVFCRETILIAAAAAIIELPTSLNLSVEIPIGDISLAVANVGWKLACVFD